MSARLTTLVLGALIAVALLLFVQAPSSAQEGAKSIVYLSVRGEGPNANAWYQGAPPAGIPIQDALSEFAGKGYSVREVRPYLRPMVTVIAPESGTIQEPTVRDEFFIILLEKTL